MLFEINISEGSFPCILLFINQH